MDWSAQNNQTSSFGCYFHDDESLAFLILCTKLIKWWIPANKNNRSFVCWGTIRLLTKHWGHSIQRLWEQCFFYKPVNSLWSSFHLYKLLLCLWLALIWVQYKLHSLLLVPSGSCCVFLVLCGWLRRYSTTSCVLYTLPVYPVDCYESVIEQDLPFSLPHFKDASRRKKARPRLYGYKTTAENSR